MKWISVTARESMPFCPDCRYEYQPHATRCSTCGAELVAELPLLPTTLPWWQLARAQFRKPRPEAVTVFGYCNIVLASWRMYLTLPWLLLILPATLAPGPPFSWRLKIILNCAMEIVYGTAIISGIGLLFMQSWARKLSVVFGCCWLALFVVIILREYYTPTAWGVRNYFNVQFAILAFCNFVYPLFLVHAMSRVEVRMAFETVPATIETELSETAQ